MIQVTKETRYTVVMSKETKEALVKLLGMTWEQMTEHVTSNEALRLEELWQELKKAE